MNEAVRLPMKLSVCLITYNHQRYIAQALNGILMQKVNFPFEIVVGEDCSTDGTREIVARYAQEFPHLIRVLPTPANLGGKPNFLRTLAACAGEYVALLEGDDYWTDANKLQRQVEFLDSHADFALCGHPVDAVNDAGQLVAASPTFTRLDYSLEDLLQLNFIPTCSSVFRQGCFESFPDWVPDDVAGDWLLHLLVSRRGKIHMLPTSMGAHRFHANGIWTSLPVSDQLEQVLRLLYIMRSRFGKHCERLIGRRIAWMHWSLAWEYSKLANSDRSWAEFRLLLSRPDLRYRVPPIRMGLLWLKLYFPGLYRQYDAFRNRLVGQFAAVS